MDAFFALLSIPILVLNFLSGIVGGIGLIIQGEWSTLFIGFGYSMIGAYLLGLLLLPPMALIPLVSAAHERGRDNLAVILAIPSLVWTHTIIMLSCAAIFSFIVQRGDGDFVHLVWGYSVATGPWVFMVNKERQAGNDEAAFPLFFAQLGTMSMMLGAWTDTDDLSFQRLVIWYLPFVVIGFILNLLIAWIEARSSRFNAY